MFCPIIIGKQRQEGTTATIGPGIPIILCPRLACTKLVVERKWRKRQVLWGNRVTKSVKLTLQQVFKIGRVEAFWFLRVKKEEKVADRRKNNMQTPPDWN